MFKLQTHNFEDLTTEGGLNRIRKDLPQSISDAMAFVKAVGERYLWVDTLCLVQDDVHDVCLGIEMMTSIYQGSYFTIVAASGSDANAGLPGLHHHEEGSGRVQVIRDIAPNVRMTVIHSIDWHLRKSVYNERGWTLQELVLPRRTAIFINGQVYFRCQAANWSEETWADEYSHWLDADDSNISRIPDPFDGFLPSSWAYQKLCEDFSSRKLRDDGDALRALAGVTRPMAGGMETDLIEGLPGYYLDHFLLFIASNADLRRRDRFASYSWAGWDGRFMWPRENFEWFEEVADGSLQKVRRTENILKYLQDNRLVQWQSIGRTASSESLSSWPYKKPSLLFQFMKEHPAVFLVQENDQDPVRDPKYSADAWCSSSMTSGDLPSWDSDSDTSKDERKVSRTFARKSQALEGVSIKVFDLANGEDEFGRMVSRIKNIREKRWLQNWMAQRSYRTVLSTLFELAVLIRIGIRSAKTRDSAIGPRPILRSRVDGGAHVRFRHPRSLPSSDGTNVKIDERAKCFIKQQMHDEHATPLHTVCVP